jgi:hypothetical protein
MWNHADCLQDPWGVLRHGFTSLLFSMPVPILFTHQRRRISSEIAFCDFVICGASTLPYVAICFRVNRLPALCCNWSCLIFV